MEGIPYVYSKLKEYEVGEMITSLEFVRKIEKYSHKPNIEGILLGTRDIGEHEIREQAKYLQYGYIILTWILVTSVLFLLSSSIFI